MVQTEPAKLPTFARCRAEYWNEEANRPDTATASDMDSYDVAEAVEGFLRDHAEWRRIEADASEAEARRAYAEHMARYLVGVFPNAKVNPDAYAKAVGEDLAHRSADILKDVGQKVRRTCKTLPTIAVLLDMAEAEASRRDKQAAAYRRAVDDHRAALARGKQMAEDFAKSIAPHAADLDADAVAALWEEVAGRTIGITHPNQRPEQPATDALRKLLVWTGAGDQRAADVLRGILAECRRYVEAERAAEKAGDEDGAWNAWMQRSGGRTDWRARVIAAAVPEPVQAPPKPPSGHVLPGGGRRVMHAKFGAGTVVAVNDDRIDVAFDTHGEKRVLARFLAPLDPATAATNGQEN